MSSETKKTTDQVKNTDTINLVVHRDGANADKQEINLMHVFVNMGVKFRVHVWLMVLFLIAGMLGGYLKGVFSNKVDNAMAVLTFEYLKNLDDGDIKTLDLGSLSSSYVVSQAIDRTALTNREKQNVTTSSVINNLSTKYILTEETAQKVEIAQAMIDDKASEAAGLLEIEYKYENSVIVTLNNGFGEDGKQVSGETLQNLLNNVLTVYEEYFFDNYTDFELPTDTLSGIEIGRLDYSETLDQISTAMNSLLDYIEKSDLYRFVRSSKNGLCLDDLEKIIESEISINIDPMIAYVTYSGATADKNVVITRYEYQIRQLQYQIDALDSNIKANEDLIANYRLENNSITSADGTVMNMGAIVTDYYNSLVLKQAEYFDARKNNERTILELQSRIDAMKSASTSSKVDIRSEIEAIHASCTKVFGLVNELAEELLSSKNLQASYVASVDAQVDAEGLLSSGNISNMLKFGGIGLVVAVLIWAIDGVISEMKYGEIRVVHRKKNTKSAAETETEA